MQIFAGVQEIWGIKQESGRLRCRFSYLSLTIFSESSSPRHDKLTQCCCAFTLALARLSCCGNAMYRKNALWYFFVYYSINQSKLFVTCAMSCTSSNLRRIAVGICNTLKTSIGIGNTLQKYC